MVLQIKQFYVVIMIVVKSIFVVEGLHKRVIHQAAQNAKEAWKVEKNEQKGKVYHEKTVS